MLDILLPTILFLLPIAVWSGYRVGKKSPQENSVTSHLSPRYFTGLNYLLNEEPDKAIDAFIELLKIDSETVETHLALGNLFRRRGEVDRAIRIHQNLIARPTLTRDIRKLALFELANDYMAAGLFDRAENLFKELVKEREYRKESLRHLVTIYQQIKDWDNAIETCKKMAKVSGVSQDTTIAHYYCELAQKAQLSGNVKAAHDAVKRALSINNNSVRASILEGNLYQKSGKYKDAIHSYRRIRHQDIAYLPEVLSDFISCHKIIGAEDELLKYLKECLSLGAGVSVLLVVSELMLVAVDERSMINMISNYLREKPSLKGLEQLIQIHVRHASGDAKDNLLLLHNLVIKLMKDKPVYRCNGCGYSGKTLFWQCPSCTEWETIKPILGIEGE